MLWDCIRVPLMLGVVLCVDEKTPDPGLDADRCDPADDSGSPGTP